MQQTSVEQRFICPNCAGDSLAISELNIECGKCGTSYEVRSGIPVFREGPAHFHWGVRSEKFGEVARATDRVGWHDAMMEFLSEIPREEAVLVWNRTLGPRRLALAMLLPLHRKARVLDVGSGWGTISINTASYCEQVVSMDQLLEHLEYQRAACQARGIENVTFVQAGDTPHLPFPDDSFDIAIMNGVLEWVATNSDGGPEEVQQRFLGEIARVLNPSGVLYIGIENRWNYRYFLGGQEGHIRMKYGALLPRFATDLYLRLRRGVRYREYTYALFGYRKLLSKAGLGNRRFYSAWPHYSSIQFVLPLSEGNSAQRPWNVESDHPFAASPFSYFSKTFLMTAATEEPDPVVLDRVTDEVATRMDWDTPVTVTGELFHVTSTGKASIRMESPRGPSFIAKVGLVREAGEGIAAHHKSLLGLRQHDLGPELEGLISQTTLAGEVNGFVYGLEPFYEGAGGGTVITEDAGRNRLCEGAFDFVTRLALKLGNSVKIGDEAFERLFSRPIRSLHQWFTSDEWERNAPWFYQVESRVRERVEGKEILVVPRHGDFVPENCLVNGQGRLTKVLDWELYEEDGLPLYDWITFLGVAHRPRIREEMARRGLDPESVKFHGYPQIFIAGELSAQLHRYLERLGIEASLYAPLLFMWWVKQLQDWERDMLYHPEWRSLRVFPLMERLEELIEII